MTSLLLPLLLLQVGFPMAAAFWPFDEETTTTTTPAFGDANWTLRMKQGTQCLGWDARHGLISLRRCRADPAQLWRFNRVIQSFAGHRMCLGMDRQAFVGDNCSYWDGSKMSLAMRVLFLNCDATDENQLFVQDGSLIVSQKCSNLCLTYRKIVGRFSLRPCTRPRLAIEVRGVNASQNLTLMNAASDWAKQVAKAHPAKRIFENIFSAISSKYTSGVVFSELHAERVLATLSIITVGAAAIALTLVSVRKSGSSNRDADRGSWRLIPTEEDTLSDSSDGRLL